MTKTNRLALSVLIVLSLAAFATAQSYTVTDLGGGQAFAINSLGDVVVQPYPSGNSFVWAPGGKQLSLAPLTAGYPTTPYGINNQGLVVGLSSNGQGFAAALWTNGVPLDLGNLGAPACAGTGINASAEVAGYCFLLNERTEAFLWSKATGMQGIASLQGGGGSIAQAINRFGQVVGYAPTIAHTTPYAFIWSKTTGMAKNLGKLPGYDSSSAFAINDLGQVAGFSQCINCSLSGHATLWGKAKGSMLDLGVLPGATSSFAYGINNVGQVVGGSSYSATNELHAFVWSPSTGMLDLNNLIPANSGWLLQIANAINDQGQIVGEGTLNGQTEAFLLTPQ
jgi:probable HAF family extracellular repeat protein